MGMTGSLDMDFPRKADENRLTKYGASEHQLTTAKATPLRFANAVETKKYRQTFAFKGPDDSRHADRALDIVEKMNSKIR